MPALLIVALVVGLLGIGVSSQATIGAALVGFACLLAICARVWQAEQHMTRVHGRKPAPAQWTPPTPEELKAMGR